MSEQFNKNPATAGTSEDVGYEVGGIYDVNEVCDQRGHQLVVIVLTEEDGLPIPEDFALRSVGHNYWFQRKMKHKDGYGSERGRFFECVADSKGDLDRYVRELSSEENQRVDSVSFLGDEINVEWDAQSEKLIFMP